MGNRGSDGPGGNHRGNSGGVDGRGGNSVVHTSVAVSSVHSVEGLGLTLAVVTTGVTSVAESSVATESGVSNGVSTTVSSVAPQARVSVSVIGISLSISLGLSLSLTLAVVTTRVSESSVATESGVSNAGISKTISSVSTVATKARVAKAISMPIISVGLGLSLSSSKGRTAEQNSKPEHLPCLAGKKRIPC